MNRRTAIKQFSILTGGIVLFPACDFSKEKVFKSMNHLKIDPEQESILKVLVDLIVPGGSIPGAKDLEVDGFVWVMVDDCFDKKNQETFLKGFVELEEYSKEKMGKVFTKLDSKNQNEVLLELLNDPQNFPDLNVFLSTLKALTIQGYMQSKFIMTEKMSYPLIPGKYGNCETYKTGDQINIYA